MKHKIILPPFSHHTPEERAEDARLTKLYDEGTPEFRAKCDKLWNHLMMGGKPSPMCIASVLKRIRKIEPTKEDGE